MMTLTERQKAKLGLELTHNGRGELQTNFVYVFQKRLSQASLPNNKSKVANRIINILSRIMIFCREIQCNNYRIRWSHAAVSIENNIFPKGIIILK
jgi:hypothetical protein